MKHPRIVRVAWTDSATVPGWQDGDATTAPVECVSVGFLIERTKRAVVLAQSLTEHQRGEMLAIPKFAVRRIDVLEGRR